MTWLLVHGEHVWWGVLGLTVLASPLLWRSHLHRRARRRAARVLADWSGSVSSLGAGDGWLTLRGRLAVRDDDGVVQETEGAIVAGSGLEPSAGLVLEVDDAVVPFEEPPVVRVGSEERCAGWWEEPSEAARTVRAGDDVLVYGWVGRAAEPGGYREQTVRWSFAPVGEDEDPPAVCFAEAPRVVGPPWKSRAWAVVWACALFAGVGYLLGAASYEAASQLHYADPRDPGWVLPFASVAAATPFHRDLAVDLAARSLFPDAPGRVDALSTAADLERGMTGTCAGLLRALWRDGNLRQMPDVAERCGDPESLRLGARGALLDGQLERGAELARRAPAQQTEEPDPEDLWTEVLVHLLAGDHARSAAALRIVAEAEPDEERRRAYECIALSMDIEAEPDVEADVVPLEEHTDDPGGEPCVILTLNHFAPEDRSLMLNVIYTDDLGPRYEPLADELEMEAPTEIDLPLAVPFDHPADLVVGRVLRERAPLGLDASVLESLEGASEPDLRASRAAAGSRLAGMLAMMGDTGRALVLLDEAEADLRTVVETSEEGSGWARALAWMPVRRAAVQLRDGDLDAARAELARAEPAVAEAAPTRELAAVLAYARDGDTADLHEDWEEELGVSGLEVAARTGDGEELVRWLRRHERYVTTPVAQLAAPHVREHREAVTDWLHRDEPGPLCPTMRSCRLDAIAADAHSRAIAARALGDPELAAELERRARALREALTRRDVALAWALFGRLGVAPEDRYSVTP